MTDLETMEAIFSRAGIKFEKFVLDRNAAIRSRRPDEEVGETTLTIEAGYPGFASVMTFSKDGALKSVEAYE